MDIQLIKTIEDLSLNAWPSHQVQFYDGWLLRFSYFYTHRTNCVEQIGESLIPFETKISYCEQEYQKWGTPSIFKISPLVSPSLDSMLQNRGYEIQHSTDCMIADLDHLIQISNHEVTVDISNIISESWLQSLFALKNTTNIMHRSVVPSMYRAIPKETLCASISIDGKVAATGLGILDRDYIGIYAIHVHPNFRRAHLASTLCSALLNKGRERGAIHAYLQVVSDNEPAIGLYRSLGFRYLYTYWFRVHPLHK
ncbi:MAG: GNAT family N-acetyltransferase [Lachnospiraceae bacterium]|nr:GNAT family N-acetyltransferase [Lachnospiraceae bacterium]